MKEPSTDTTPPSVTLEPLRFEHADATFEWLQSEKLRRDFLMRERPVWEQHTAYFRRLLGDSAQRAYAVYLNGEHVGNCGYKHLDVDRAEGELWIYVGASNARGLGVGRRATEDILGRGRRELGLRTVVLHVAAFNERAIRLYRSLGFEEVPFEGSADWEQRDVSIIRMKKEISR